MDGDRSLAEAQRSPPRPVLPPDLNEALQAPEPWLMKAGVGMIAAALAFTLAAACFIPYRERISGALTLTTVRAPAEVTAPIGGTLLRLATVEGQQVQASEIIAVVSHPDEREQMAQIRRYLDALSQAPLRVEPIQLPPAIILSPSLQRPYEELRQAAETYNQLQTGAEFRLQADAIEAELQGLRREQALLSDRQTLVLGRQKVAGDQLAVRRELVARGIEASARIFVYERELMDAQAAGVIALLGDISFSEEQ